MPHIFQRNINASLGIIHGDVLPEVGQLQSGAGVVGELLALGVAITAQVEDEMAYGIRRIAAIGEDVFESLETSNGLVLAEGDEQVGEFVLGNAELSHSLRQRDKNRMAWSSRVTGIELRLPLIEQGERCRGIADFITEIVGDSAIGVNVQEVLTQLLGQKPGRDGEVFVMRAG